jgi:hypothetical protein
MQKQFFALQQKVTQKEKIDFLVIDIMVGNWVRIGI